MVIFNSFLPLKLKALNYSTYALMFYVMLIFDSVLVIKLL